VKIENEDRGSKIASLRARRSSILDDLHVLRFFAVDFRSFLGIAMRPEQLHRKNIH
jgi:hypothetical protein